MPTGMVRPIYESPPGSNSNDGALPTAYNPDWPIFNNLTPQQILAFEAFPQDLTKYAATVRWRKEVSNITVGGIPINMSEANRALLLGLARAADRGLNGGFFSFTDDGASYRISAAEGIALVDTVMTYIQTCRNTEKAMFDGIIAGTIKTRNQIDTAFANILNSF